MSRRCGNGNWSSPSARAPVFCTKRDARPASMRPHCVPTPGECHGHPQRRESGGRQPSGAVIDKNIFGRGSGVEAERSSSFASAIRHCSVTRGFGLRRRGLRPARPRRFCESAKACVRPSCSKGGCSPSRLQPSITSSASSSSEVSANVSRTNWRLLRPPALSHSWAMAA